MTLDDETLQRYFDGDLPDAEAETVRAALEASPEHQAQLDQLGRLRDLLRMATDASEDDLGSEALFAKVRTGIDADTGEEAAPEAAPKAEPEPEAEPKAAPARLRAIDGGRTDSDAAAHRGARRSWTMGLAVALAAAAVLAFMLPKHASSPKHVKSGKHTPTAVIEPPQGSEVEKVDFGDNTGTVFAVQGAAGAPVAVVWIDDTPQGTQ